MAIALGTAFARLNAGSSSVKRMFKGSVGIWNADAADWIRRVQANDGAVSTATANAVTDFCNAIDSAGIRNKFYRLNLFCGTGLNACLVPLYRGPSLIGTQYGNVTDTNNGPFSTGDYVETGASGGLTGNGSSKYLDTGLSKRYPPTESDRHVSAYVSSLSATAAPLGSYDSSTPIGYYQLYCSASATNIQFYSGGNFNGLSGTAAAGFWMGTGTVVKTLYKDGASVASGSAGANSASVSTFPFFVFATNNGGVAGNRYNGRLAGYSLGLSVTGTQAAAYNAAIQAFQTALERNA
jgi:hypothetical protein